MHIYPFELIKRDPGEGFPSGYIFPDSTPEVARKTLYEAPQTLESHKLCWHGSQWAVLMIAWKDPTVVDQHKRTGHKAIKGMIIPAGVFGQINPWDFFDQYLLPDLTSPWDAKQVLEVQLKEPSADASFSEPAFKALARSEAVLKKLFQNNPGFFLCSFATFKLPAEKAVCFAVDESLKTDYEYVSQQPALQSRAPVTMSKGLMLWKVLAVIFFVTTLVFYFQKPQQPPVVTPLIEPEPKITQTTEPAIESEDFDGFSGRADRSDFLKKLGNSDNWAYSNTGFRLPSFSNLPGNYRPFIEYLEQNERTRSALLTLRSDLAKQQADIGNTEWRFGSLGNIKVSGSAGSKYAVAIDLNWKDNDTIQKEVNVSLSSIKGQFENLDKSQIRLIRDLKTLVPVEESFLKKLKESLEQIGGSR
ncbi:MAG TPA: hypothetical protein DCG57_19375 [Candidatus Riflebacteria bacterium]|jgi:hypothetical protein|nr:hypothetical protein [Candidatus Riflebacteria bacterium]